LMEYLLHTFRVIRHCKREHQKDAGFLRIEVVAEQTDIRRIFGDVAATRPRRADDDYALFDCPLDGRQRKQRFAARADTRYDDAARTVRHGGVIHVTTVVLVPVDDIDFWKRIHL